MSDLSESWSDRCRAIWRRPRSVTALVPVDGVSTEQLHARLAALAPDLHRALAAVPDLHTLRIAALPPPATPGGTARVLLSSVHDAPLEDHLAALVAAAGRMLVGAFAGADYRGRPEDVPALLVRHRAADQTFHLGAINHSVPEILGEQRLLEEIERFTDERLDSGDWNADTAAERIRLEIRAHVLALPPSAQIPRDLQSGVSRAGRLLRTLDVFATFALPMIGVLAPHVRKAIRCIEHPLRRALAWSGFGLWWVYGGLFTGAALLFARILEVTEVDVVLPPADPAKVARIESVEDLQLKNVVTLWFPVRDTWIRRTMLHLILWGSERGCRHFWTAGALADIDTIHYARILQVDGGRTMLFMSDYDGSLDRYLLDFLGVGSNAVIPISSNVEGCPKTRWLFRQEDPRSFGPRWRNMIRRSQLETPVWYSAYPDLSVRDVLSNRELRAGLFREHMSEEEARRWTAML